MNVIELLDETCTRFPAATALMWGLPGRGRTITFGDLAQRSQRLAALFRKEGLQAGDAVVIFVPMSGPLYEVMAAVLRLGLIPVFLEPAAWRQALDQTICNLRVRGFVGTPAACALRWLVPALRRIPHAFVTGPMFPGATSLRTAAQCDPATHVEPCSAASTALVTFTSGSTGRSKGVIRSHGMLLATHRVLSGHLALRPGESNLATLPFVVFSNLAAGAGSVIPELDPRAPTDVDPGRLVRQIREWGVSGLVATPFLARRIAEFCLQNGIRLTSLGRVFTGGAPVLPELLEKLAAVAPQARIAAIYGATEAEPIAVAEMADFGPLERDAIREGHGLLVGRPVEGLGVRVLEDRWGAPRGSCTTLEFEQARVQDGARGEIVVCGANVSSSYLDEGDNRSQKLVVDGGTWHRTGDAGYLDAAGRLWLTGRCAARIVRNGDTLYPLQIEAALSGTGGVARATMIKDSHENLVLVIEPAGDPADVDMGELASRLAWCQPQEFVLVRRIPMDPRHHAKVMYPELLLALERRQWLARAAFPVRS